MGVQRVGNGIWTALLSCFLLLAPSARATVVYVDRAAAGPVENGLTWETAFHAIEPALAAAPRGGQVWVAAGLYDEIRTSADGALVIPEEVELLGGFSGDETSADLRDPAANTTVIEAARARSGLPAWHAVRASALAVLDGFHVRGGVANGPLPEDMQGGGLLVTGSFVRVANCVFTGNQADRGGAIAQPPAMPVAIRDTVFLDNDATNSGGAVQLDDEAALSDVLFDGNTAGTGGALHSRTGRITVSQAEFANNTASFGGAIALEGGRITTAKARFTGNRALNGDGGAVWLFRGSITLDRVLFADNDAFDRGGAIAILSTAECALLNCILSGNRAVRNAGALLNFGQLTMEHVTGWANTAVQGGGFANFGGEFLVFNSDFQDNAPADLFFSVAVRPVLVSHSIYAGTEGEFSGENNFNVRPVYRDPAGGDFRPLPDSPTLDRGIDLGVGEDYRGLPRPVGEGPDIGAHEFFDVDGDGMEDFWEEAYGLDPADPADADEDLDGDGLTNLEEFILDTDPTDPESPARTLYVDVDGDDQAAGTVDAPFRTLEHALAVAAESPFVERVLTGPGDFESGFTLPPGLALYGAGPGLTRFRGGLNAALAGAVFDMGEDCTLRDCTITLEPGALIPESLVRAEDVRVVLDNVVLDGVDIPAAMGLDIAGAGASGSAIRGCVFKRLALGVRIRDAAADFAGNTFGPMRGDAIFIRMPEPPPGEEPPVPMLGKCGVAGSGGNVFKSVTGFHVVNFTEHCIPAEMNDWGSIAPHAIRRRLFGAVDFMPYVGGLPVCKDNAVLGCGPAAGNARGGLTGDAAAVMLMLLFLSSVRLRGGKPAG